MTTDTKIHRDWQLYQPRTPEISHEAVARHTADFEARGGVIQRIPVGASGLKPISHKQITIARG